MKCMTKCPLSSLKVEMEFRVILWNHALAGPLSVVGNALYIILLGTPCKCMRVLNGSRWLRIFWLVIYLNLWHFELGWKGTKCDLCREGGVSMVDQFIQVNGHSSFHGVHHYVWQILKLWDCPSNERVLHLQDCHNKWRASHPRAIIWKEDHLALMA